LKQLYDEGGLSKSDLDAIEMSLKVSRSAYRNLLENTLLRSPISGVVSARNYDRGDMYAGQPIFVVQQITPVKLLIGISETDYTKVHVGDAVEITADALPGEIFTGKIKRVYPTIDPATHTVTTEIQVTNADRKLRPGMFAKVKVEFSVNHSVTVPDVAVVKQQGSGQRFVFVLNGDSTVSLRIVTLGRHFGTSYEILDGLQEGEVVVTKGQASLKNGSEVQVMDE
jgi:RND family efflux transporter MFP subunit